MQMYYDCDVNPGTLREKHIAVIGFGSQGSAQAKNLRESGCRVSVGLRPNSATRAQAVSAGFSVLSIADAAAAADVIMMLVPDEAAPDVYARDVANCLGAGKAVGFSHGFAIHYRLIQPRNDADVFMVAPKAPGHLLRSEYSAGGGVPCLIAIHRDATGTALPLALAYACAIGGGRAGIAATTFREEVETDLFGEQAVLCGGVTSLITAGFETLVEAGYAPELAYFECLHELKLIVDLIQRDGIAGMRGAISNTAEYGDLTRGPFIVNRETKERMRRLLLDIRSGAFAREWMDENRGGCRHFAKLREQTRAHAVEEVGIRLRSMMPWLSTERSGK